MATRKGTIKKTELTAFSNPRAGGIIAMGVDEDDAVIAVQLTDGTTRSSSAPATAWRSASPKTTSRPMGRTAYGVRGIQLREGDEVVAMEVAQAGRHAADRHRARLRQADRARRVPRPEPRRLGHQDRDHRPERPGRRHRPGARRRELLLITEQGKILRTPASDIRTIGRATQGVRLMDLERRTTGWSPSRWSPRPKKK